MAPVFSGGRYGIMFRQTRKVSPSAYVNRNTLYAAFEVGFRYSRTISAGPTMFPRDVDASAMAIFRLTSVPRGSCQPVLLFKRVIAQILL